MAFNEELVSDEYERAQDLYKKLSNCVIDYSKNDVYLNIYPILFAVSKLIASITLSASVDPTKFDLDKVKETIMQITTAIYETELQ